MPVERNAFKLGLTLIAVLILFCCVLWFLAPRGEGDMTLYVRYPHDRFTTVLKPGGEVLCGGKTVGSIFDLKLEEMKNPKSGDDDYYAVVTFKVDSTLGLRKDCHIIPTEALLGGMGALVIKDRGLADPLQAGAMIDGEPTTSISDLTAMLAQQLDARNPTSLMAIIQSQLDPTSAASLLGKIHKSLDDINVMTRGLSREMDLAQKTTLLSKLHEIFNNFTATTNALREQLDPKATDAALAKVHQALDELNGSLLVVRGMLEDNREPLKRTVQHVESTSRILEEQIAAKLAEQLDTSNAAGLLARIHVSIERLGRSLEDANSITGDVRNVITLNRNNLDTMISNLKETSDHLKAGSKEIRLNPWLLLYTPKPDEIAQSQLFGAARAFSEGATRLDDTVSRLEAISNRPGGNAPENREELDKIRAELGESFKQFNQVEQKLWEQLNIK